MAEYRVANAEMSDHPRLPSQNYEHCGQLFKPQDSEEPLLFPEVSLTLTAIPALTSVVVVCPQCHSGRQVIVQKNHLKPLVNNPIEEKPTGEANG